MLSWEDLHLGLRTRETERKRKEGGDAKVSGLTKSRRSGDRGEDGEGRELTLIQSAGAVASVASVAAAIPGCSKEEGGGSALVRLVRAREGGLNVGSSKDSTDLRENESPTKGRPILVLLIAPWLKKGVKGIVEVSSTRREEKGRRSELTTNGLRLLVRENVETSVRSVSDGRSCKSLEQSLDS